jgi:hypothetical protein
MVTLLIITASLVALGGGLYFFAIENERNSQVNQKVSNLEVVKIAREHNGRVSPALLSERSLLTLPESERKLYIMLSEGVFHYEYDENYQPVFVLNNLIRRALHNPENRLNTHTSLAPSRLTDSEVIKLAVETKGKLTATLLCLKAGISIDEAQATLERLQLKGVFDLQVTENGSMLYVLNDIDLLSST